MGRFAGIIPGFQETGEGFIIKVPIAGVDQKDIHLNVTDTGLEIKAIRKQEKKSSNGGYQSYSRSFSQFYQSLSLPSGADTQHIDASYKEGILTIKLKKKLKLIK